MNTAEVNIDCLRAAEQLLREHDARISAHDDERKQLRRDRVPLAERVQACIDVLCGRATPDLFTPTAEQEPAAPPVPDITPPLAPGEHVPLDVIKATAIGDIAAIQDDRELAAIAAKLASPEFEVVTVGELWEWADEDFAHWGGFGGAGQCGIVGALSVATVAVETARRFGVVLEGWLEANGCRLTEAGWVSAADVPTTPAKAKKRAERKAADADLTAEEEARVNAKPAKSPGDERKLKAIAEWRRRQADGTATPTWGLWAEFQVYLTDGRMVAVLYDPGDGGVEFIGEATSDTGYHLEYSKLSNGKSPKKPIEAWAKDKAEELAREVRKAKEQAAKKKLKAPPAKAAKPKSKAKGAK